LGLQNIINKEELCQKEHINQAKESEKGPMDSGHEIVLKRVKE